MLDAAIRDNARMTPRAPAVVLPGRVVSYAEFDADIDRCGAALADLGVRDGVGVVSLRIQAPYLAHVALAACARLGVATSPAMDMDADNALTDGEDGADAAAIRLDRTWIQTMLAAPARPLPALDLAPEATGRVMLSSGTTRTPRRVALSWRRLDVVNIGYLRVFGAGRLGTWFPATGVEALLGFGQAWLAWTVGAAVGAGMTVESLPDWFEAGPEGVACMTPTQLRTILAVLPAGYRAQPRWRIVTGGSQLPLAVADEAARRLTPDIRIVYGSTEASLLATGYGADVAEHPGCVGVTPAGAEVQIVDDDGRPTPPGQPGEVRIRGERMASRYLNDAAGSAERFRDGWFLTRDVARRLPDGRMVLEGRLDDRMIVRGAKVMPSVFETAALACPGIVDAAAFAVPDAGGIDQAWLAVASEPGFERERLVRHLGRQSALPPCSVAWVDAIPRNAMGKVERDRLRQAVLAVRGSAA